MKTNGLQIPFSEAEGFIYGVDVDGNVSQILNISDKTVKENLGFIHLIF